MYNFNKYHFLIHEYSFAFLQQIKKVIRHFYLPKNNAFYMIQFDQTNTILFILH